MDNKVTLSTIIIHFTPFGGIVASLFRCTYSEFALYENALRIRPIWLFFFPIQSLRFGSTKRLYLGFSHSFFQSLSGLPQKRSQERIVSYHEVHMSDGRT